MKTPLSDFITAFQDPDVDHIHLYGDSRVLTHKGCWAIIAYLMDYPGSIAWLANQDRYSECGEKSIAVMIDLLESASEEYGFKYSIEKHRIRLCLDRRNPDRPSSTIWLISAGRIEKIMGLHADMIFIDHASMVSQEGLMWCLWRLRPDIPNPKKLIMANLNGNTPFVYPQERIRVIKYA